MTRKEEVILSNTISVVFICTKTAFKTRLSVVYFILILIFTYLDSVNEAVTLVLTDEGFQLPSLHAKGARSCTENLVKWIIVSENVVKVNLCVWKNVFITYRV